MRLAVGLALAMTALGAACAPAPAPIDPVPPSGSASPAAQPEPPEFALGPWRPEPIRLGDRQIAVVSDACASAAREQLGEAEANLQTALVDARGENVATAILADDTRAIECRVRIDGGGGITVDGVARLSPSAVAPVADGSIGLSSMVQIPDREGDRIAVIGRIGPNATAVKNRFADDSEVVSSIANGWYAAWWPGHEVPSAIDAVDNSGQVVGSVPAPENGRDGRLGGASWWLDPQAPPLTAASTTVRALVHEEACAGGKSPEGRIEGPLVDLTEVAVMVVLGVRPLPGPNDCVGNMPFPFTFELPEPLADRALVDGGKMPPRDARNPP